jgi:hypothetical protein
MRKKRGIDPNVTPRAIHALISRTWRLFVDVAADVVSGSVVVLYKGVVELLVGNGGAVALPAGKATVGATSRKPKANAKKVFMLMGAAIVILVGAWAWILGALDWKRRA